MTTRRAGLVGVPARVGDRRGGADARARKPRAPLLRRVHARHYAITQARAHARTARMQACIFAAGRQAGRQAGRLPRTHTHAHTHAHRYVDDLGSVARLYILSPQVPTFYPPHPISQKSTASFRFLLVSVSFHGPARHYILSYPHRSFEPLQIELLLLCPVSAAFFDHCRYLTTSVL